MRVFLSWSGDKSRLVAEALRDWLPDVVNAVDPWMSSEDIDKGAVGIQAIADELQGCSFGIICLTRDNQDKPWINYEAGALSKAVGDTKSRVATFLIDIDRPSEVTGPVSAFQATLPTLTDVTKLIASLDAATGTPRDRDRLSRVVERLWPALAEKLTAAREREPERVAPVRSTADMLAEILDLSRQMSRSLAHPASEAARPVDVEDLLLNTRAIRRSPTAQRNRQRVLDMLGDRLLTRERTNFAYSWDEDEEALGVWAGGLSDDERRYSEIVARKLGVNVVWVGSVDDLGEELFTVSRSKTK